MAVSATFHVEGLYALREGLRKIPRAMQRKVLRRALRAAALPIQRAARAKAPVLQERAPHRVRGLVRRSITVRASRLQTRRGSVGVFITVHRSKAARMRGSYSLLASRRVIRPNDPFYFRFLELGTKRMPARPFLGPALQEKGQEATREFMRVAVPAVQQLTARNV